MLSCKTSLGNDRAAAKSEKSSGLIVMARRLSDLYPLGPLAKSAQTNKPCTSSQAQASIRAFSISARLARGNPSSVSPTGKNTAGIWPALTRVSRPRRIASRIIAPNSSGSRSRSTAAVGSLSRKYAVFTVCFHQPWVRPRSEFSNVPRPSHVCWPFVLVTLQHLAPHCLTPLVSGLE
jgi:hypothetical protein